VHWVAVILVVGSLIAGLIQVILACVEVGTNGLHFFFFSK
jgi:hypothetical protein